MSLTLGSNHVANTKYPSKDNSSIGTHQNQYLTNGQLELGLTTTLSPQDPLEDYTRRLEEEGQSISHHLEQCGQLSDTVSMHSITSTDDSFHVRGPSPSSRQQHPLQHAPPPPSHASSSSYPYNNHHDHDGYQGYGQGSPDEINSSKMSSHLLNSCLREEDRGTLNSGYIRDSGNMDYLQEDPYAGHRFPPHDPYYSGGGGGGGGGGQDGYQGNTSFDGNSEQSYHSDRNRVPVSYSGMPNGGPYMDNLNTSDNLYPSERHSQDWMGGGSPQPPKSISPQDYCPPQHGGDASGSEYPPRESPYHNLPPYQKDGDEGGYRNSPNYPPNDLYQSNVDGYYPPEAEEAPSPGHGYLPSAASPPPSSALQQHYPQADMHADYRDRHSYAGSRSSFQGPPGDQLHGSDNYNDPYLSGHYNGDDQYIDGQMGQGEGPPRDYSFHGDPQDQLGVYDDGGGPVYPNHQQSPYPEDDQYPQPEDYREIHNRSTGAVDEPYHHQSFDPQQQQPLPHDDSYSPQPQPYDQYPPEAADHSSSEAPPHSRHSLDQGYGDHLADTPHPNQSFHNDMPDGYLREEDPYQRSQGGLPPVQSDPFANDPFQDQQQQHSRLMEDPYYPGSSSAGDPVPYDDRGPPYQDQIYNDRAQPYDDDDGCQPYPGDEHDHYNAGGPVYPEETGSNDGPVGGVALYKEDPYFPEQEAAQRLDQLTLNAAPSIDGRQTPSVDGRGGAPTSFLPARDPDLQEVIDFLGSPDDIVIASAAAYLQHLTYMDDAIKAKTRSMGGIRPLIRLLGHGLEEVHKNACGALQNLSYGQSNTENKRTVKTEGGIPELIRLLRKTDQADVKESVTSVLWNLSSCEDLKQDIIEAGLSVLVNVVILKYTSYNQVINPWTTVLRNTTGILRNVSSSGFGARKRLRECKGMVNSLINILKFAVDDTASSHIDNKPVENTVCILRNLSYRIQEVVDPDFHKKRSLPKQQLQTGTGKPGKGGDSPGCFGNKSSKAKNSQAKSGSQQANAPPKLPPASIEYRSLWGSEIHTLYSHILRRCTNPITMEAAAGAIQNLTACDWQPAVESRDMVRKEKSLPLLVDMITSESERVVCATVTALRNLAIDDKNKDLIGRYAIEQLVNRLPRDNASSLSDDTICAVVALLYEVIKDNQTFAGTFVKENGLPRLMHINRSDGRYLPRTLKFTSTLLKTLYNWKSLHEEYARQHYTEVDFTMSRAVPRTEGAHPPTSSHTPTSSNHTTPYNTLSRPMSGQGYDDSTLTPAKAHYMQQRGASYFTDSRMPPLHSGPMDMNPDYNRNNWAMMQDNRDHMNYSTDRLPEETPLADMGPGPGYAPLDEPPPHRTKPPVGGVSLFPALSPNEMQGTLYQGDSPGGNEPLYAQVNKGSRRRLDPYSDSPHSGNQSDDGGGGGADSWV